MCVVRQVASLLVDKVDGGVHVDTTLSNVEGDHDNVFILYCAKRFAGLKAEVKDGFVDEEFSK